MNLIRGRLTNSTKTFVFKSCPVPRSGISCQDGKPLQASLGSYEQGTATKRLSVLVFQGFHNKALQTGWWSRRAVFACGSGGCRDGLLRGHKWTVCPGCPLCLVAGHPPCVFTAPPSLWPCLQDPVTFGVRPTLCPQFNLISSCKHPVSKYGPLLRLGSTCESGGRAGDVTEFHDSSEI